MINYRFPAVSTKTFSPPDGLLLWQAAQFFDHFNKNFWAQSSVLAPSQIPTASYLCRSSALRILPRGPAHSLAFSCKHCAADHPSLRLVGRKISRTIAIERRSTNKPTSSKCFLEIMTSKSNWIFWSLKSGSSLIRIAKEYSCQCLLDRSTRSSLYLYIACKKLAVLRCAVRF